MKIYGGSISGNCLKVRWVADRLGLAYDWGEVDIPTSQTHTPAYLAMNPAGQVPTVVLDDGGPLSSIADVALVAYTRIAHHEGGFDLADHPAVKAWVGRVEAALPIA